MSAIIHLARAVLYVFRLLLAAVASLFGLASLVAPWRIHGWCKAYADVDSLNDATWVGFGLFGLALFEYLTLVVFCIVLVTWRSCQMFGRISKKWGKSTNGELAYNESLRFAVWKSFGEVLADTPFILLCILNTAMIWHAPLFWYNLTRLIAQGESKKRIQQLIFSDFLLGVAEFFLLPFGLLVVGTWYRVSVTRDLIRQRQDKSTRTDVWGKNLDRLALRVEWVTQGLHVLLDLGVLLLALVFTVPLVLRYTAVYKGVKKEYAQDINRGEFIHRVRNIVLQNILLSFRELVGVLAYVILLPGVYRFYTALSSALESCGDQADPTCHAQPTSVVPEFPEGGGVKLHIKGLKTPDLTISSARLYLRDEKFWDLLGEVMGSGVALVAKAFLPFHLTPNSGGVGKDGKRDTLVAADFKEGETQFETTVFFDIGAKKRTIVKNLDKIGRSTTAAFTIEFGDNHDGTLMNLDLNFGDLIQCAEDGTSLPLPEDGGYTVTVSGNYVTDITHESTADMLKNAKKVEGQLFCDVMAVPALIQLGLFLSDIAGAVLFVLLHLIPWRAYRMWGRVKCTEPVAKKLRVQDRLKKLLSFIGPEGANVEELCAAMEDAIDKSVKASVAMIPSGAYGAYQYHHRGYIPVASEDTDVIMKVFDTLGAQRTRFEEAGETWLAEDVTRLMTLLFERLRAYAVQVVEAKRYALSLRQTETEDHRPHYLGSRLRATKSCTLDAIFPCLGTVQCSYFQPAVAGAAQDAQKGDDASVNENGDSSKRPPQIVHTGRDFFRHYSLTLKNVKKGGTEVLPHPTQLMASAAGRHYRETISEQQQAVRDTVDKLAQQDPERLQKDIDTARLEKKKWSLGGVKSAVFSEVRQFAIDLGVLLCLVFLLVTVYRLPTVLSALCRRRLVGDGPRSIIAKGAFEILVDFTYLLRVLCIVAGVRNIFSFAGDVVETGIRTKSVRAMRQVVDYYTGLALGDFVSIISFVFTFRALRWCVGAIAVGLLTPGVLLERTFFPDNESSKFAGFLIVAACAWLYATPIALVHTHLTEGDVLVPLAGVMGSIVVVALISLAVETVRTRERYEEGGGPDEALQPVGGAHHHAVNERREHPLGRPLDRLARNRFVRLNWFNGSQFVYPVMEAVWLAALVARETTASEASGLRDASRYVFLEVSTSDSTTGEGAYPLGLWVAFALIVVYYILVALPVVALAIQSSVAMCKHNSWVFFMSFLGYPAQLFIIYNMGSFVVCDDPPGIDDNYTVLPFDNRVVCYEGSHLSWAYPVLLLLPFYIFTTVVRVPEYSTARAALLDIITLDLYEAFLRYALGIAALACVFSRGSLAACCSVVTIAGVWCAGWTLAYPTVFNVDRCTSVDSFQLWRAFCYYAAVCATVAVAVVDSSGSAIAGAGLLGGGVLLGAALLACGLHRLANEDTNELEVTPAQLQEQLLQVYGKLCARRELAGSMSGTRWKKFVRGNVRSSQLALALMRLEHHTTVRGCDPLFLSMRDTWYTEVWNLVDPSDARLDYQDRLDYHYDRDEHDELLYECLCPCCASHYHMDLPCGHRQVNTVADLPKLMELLQRFGNAVLLRDGGGDDAPVDYPSIDDALALPADTGSDAESGEAADEEPEWSSPGLDRASSFEGPASCERMPSQQSGGLPRAGSSSSALSQSKRSEAHQEEQPAESGQVEPVSFSAASAPSDGGDEESDLRSPLTPLK